MILSFYSQKGGTGRTTAAYMTAHILAQRGYKVLALDIDAQTNLTQALGITSETPTILQALKNKRTMCDYIINIDENLDAIPGDIRTAITSGNRFNSLTEYSRKYDYIIIDLPSQLSELTISVNSLCDGVIIPLSLDTFSYNSIEQIKSTYDSLKTINPQFKIYGVLRTMGDRTNMSDVMAELIEKRVTDELNARTFHSVIRNSVRAKEIIATHTFPAGKPCGVIQDYNAFIDEFLSLTEG